MPCPKLTVAEMGLRPKMIPPCRHSPSVRGAPLSRSFKPKTPTLKWMLNKCCRQNPFRSQGPRPAGSCWCHHSCGHTVCATSTSPGWTQGQCHLRQREGCLGRPPSPSGTLKFSHPEISPQLLLPSDSSGLPHSSPLIYGPKMKHSVSPNGPSLQPSLIFLEESLA